MKKYLTCAETAKLIRADLKQNFPATKFSVRSDTYAGGASINIRWIDGQPEKQVEAVVQKYEASGFDGMIDYQYSKSHWLLPDDSITLAYREGTLECRGTVSGIKIPRPHEEAQEIRLGANYIFCRRELSLQSKRTVIALIEKKWGLPQPLALNEKGYLVQDWMHEGAHCWVSQLIHREGINLTFPLNTEEGA